MADDETDAVGHYIGLSELFQNYGVVCGGGEGEGEVIIVRKMECGRCLF